MRNARDLLNELRALDESTQIEAKLGGGIDRSVLETVCAFANEPGLGGGYLILGVARSEQPGLFGLEYEVEGVGDPDRLQRDLATQCRTVFNHPIRPNMVAESIGDRVVVIVFVPEAAQAEKPIYLKSLGLPRGAFRRMGPTDQEGTEDDLIALYAGHQIDTFDASPLHDADLSDFDVTALNMYRELRADANSDAEELNWSDEDLLRALGCVVLDHGTLRLTVAGVLLFGTARALRRCFPMMRIDYIRMPGRRWVENPDARYDTVEIRAPLLHAVRRAVNAIRDDLMVSFSLPEGSLTREDEPMLPLRVVREAVVNAVMHRSYRIQGPVQILRYANRIEIRNPGHSLKAEEQLGEPGSETRNPRVAAVLHEIRMAETKGSGIRAMRELMLNHDLLPPTFESTRRPDQFVTTLLFHHFLGDTDLVWLRHLTAESLSDEEARALVFVREVGAIDNAAYRSINRTDTLNASAHLRRLRDLGLLEMKGAGSRTYYLPGAAFAAGPPQPTTQTHQAASDPHQVTSQTHQVERYSHQVNTDSHQGVSAGVPASLRDRLPQRGQRPRREDLHALIRDLCTWRSQSAREIAAWLGGRNLKTLVRDHLTPMVEAGELAYTIPQMSNHPDQRYTTSPADEPNG
jgi:ATP-dependent DNA helicase RecG